MTDKELEDAFEEAAKTWNSENPMIDRRMARYFFYAGGSFGTEAASKLHNKTMEAFRRSVSDGVATLTR